MNSPYYIPVAIHYYMLNKHSGYYARMQTFYSKDHYGPWAPIYFQNGAAYKQGLFSSSPEFYFATPNFLNSSGGYFRPYYDQNISALWDDAAAAKRTYHFTSKPNVLITRGDIGQYWGAEGDNYDLMSKEVMSTKGDWHNPGQSANIWVYKNFTYRFTWGEDVSSNYHTYVLACQVPSRVGRLRDAGVLDQPGPVQDLRPPQCAGEQGTPTGTTYGFYVVMGQFRRMP